MTQIEKIISEEKLELMMSDSFVYDTIRISSLEKLITKEYLGITERCRVIWNPIRHILIPRPHDKDICRYFDIEVLDHSLNPQLAESYLKVFVSTLIEFSNNNLTYIQSLESRFF